MLHAYGASVAGPWHAKAGIPCQDAHASWVADDVALAVAAASDGLGSESFSHVGSATAVEAAVAHCRDHATAGAAPEETLKVLRAAYGAAYAAVIDEADEMSESPGEFDSTLCLALLDGNRLFWGHSGDSGLVAGMEDGTYRLVTTMQRDEEGRVFPLCFDDHWEFGVLEGVSTVLLCTDGVLEGMIAPPILGANTDCPLDRSKAHMFLHPLEDDAEHLAEVERQAAAYLEAYPRELIDDDKTVVVLFDDAHLPASQPDAYYAEPDWEGVRARAYADLYASHRQEPTPQAACADKPDGAAQQSPATGEKNPPSVDAAPPRPAPSPRPRPASPRPQVVSNACPNPDAARTICRMGSAVSSSVRSSSPALRRAAAATFEAGAAVGRGCVRAATEMARAVDEWLSTPDGTPPGPPSAPPRD